MKPSMLMREAWASSRARLVPSLMIAILCASMSATTLLTVGRTAGAQAAVLERVEQAGSRQLVVGDRLGSGLIGATVVDAVAGLGSVEGAVGLTIARDVRAGPLAGGGAAVPAWGAIGELGTAIDLVAGRMPTSGEAVVSRAAAKTLGLDGPAGYVVRGEDEFAVVGTFVARPPFEDLDAGVVVPAAEGAVADTLHVVAQDATDVADVQRITLAILAAPGPEDLSIQSATALASLEEDVADDLGSFSRYLLLLVLGAGAALTSVVVVSDALLRRADLGRRRALGATRGVILALVVTRTFLAALVGTLAGGAIATAVTRAWPEPIPATFTLGTMVLTVLVAVAATIGPALFAAGRDPVSVLRTP